MKSTTLYLCIEECLHGELKENDGDMTLEQQRPERSALEELFGVEKLEMVVVDTSAARLVHKPVAVGEPCTCLAK
jgi:hypothetical protein